MFWFRKKAAVQSSHISVARISNDSSPEPMGTCLLTPSHLLHAQGIPGQETRTFTATSGMKKKFHAHGATWLPSGQDMTSMISMMTWYYWIAFASQITGRSLEEGNQHNKRFGNEKPYESRWKTWACSVWRTDRAAGTNGQSLQNVNLFRIQSPQRESDWLSSSHTSISCLGKNWEFWQLHQGRGKKINIL